MIYPSIHFGFLVSSKLVLPFFVRSALLKEGIEKQPDNIANILKLPLSIFSTLVLTGKLGGDNPDVREVFLESDDVISEMDALNPEIGFDGFFRLIPELVPDGENLSSVDPFKYDEFVQEKYTDDTVWTIPLRHQPKLIGGCRYKDGAEIIKEVRTAVEDLGVELPADFPYWKVIGKLEGTTWDGD